MNRASGEGPKCRLTIAFESVLTFKATKFSDLLILTVLRLLKQFLSRFSSYRLVVAAIFAPQGVRTPLPAIASLRSESLHPLKVRSSRVSQDWSFYRCLLKVFLEP